MALHLEHSTLAGDRWDLLARVYYGDALQLLPLLQANPDHAHLLILPAGLTLTIPVLEMATTAPSTPVEEGGLPWL